MGTVGTRVSVIRSVLGGMGDLGITVSLLKRCFNMFMDVLILRNRKNKN